jgi:hypothetical protein
MRSNYPSRTPAGVPAATATPPQATEPEPEADTTAAATIRPLALIVM